jgi:hypothetical protein
MTRVDGIPKMKVFKCKQLTYLDLLTTTLN